MVHGDAVFQSGIKVCVDIIWFPVRDGIPVNPHPRSQKNLLLCSLRGPRGPQKLSSILKKICKPRDHCSIFYFKEGPINLYWSNQNKISNLFPCRHDKALIYQNYVILLLSIAVIHVGVIGISLLIDIHQLIFSHTPWYKAVKVYRCLNCKHFTIRLLPIMDSGVRTDPAAAMA